MKKILFGILTLESMALGEKDDTDKRRSGRNSERGRKV